MKSTIVKFTTKPHKDTFAATLKEAQATQKAGNKEIKVFVSKAEDNVFFVYERWADIAAITSHDNESHTKS
jgi:quinol monooxygenase YgiN